MSWLFRPFFHLLKFSIFHGFIMPLVLMACNANQLFPKVDKVSASELNVRADSTTSAYSLGYLRKGQEVDIIHYGKDWHQISKHQPLTLTSTEEEIREYIGSNLYISSHYVDRVYQDLYGGYVTFAIILHFICYLIMLIVYRNNFLEVLWNQMFATDTIPLGIKTAYYSITGVFTKKETLEPWKA